jgi:hypothetical protein
MADALDKLKNPIVVTLDEVARAAPGNFAEWLRDRRNRRVIPHRFEANDYERVRNGDSKDGLWVIGGVRQAASAARNGPPHPTEQVQPCSGIANGDE